MQNLQEFISHLRHHAAQSQGDIVEHSRRIEELKQKISALEQGLQRMKEEDAKVQLICDDRRSRAAGPPICRMMMTVWVVHHAGAARNDSDEGEQAGSTERSSTVRT
jgi:hypothetical protein